MPRLAPGLALTLLVLLLPVPGRAADPGPAGKGKGGTSSLDLGCAVARAAGVESVCRELAFFKHEDERRMGEELGQLLDGPARHKALGAVGAELAEKAKKAMAARDCPAARPLCPFPRDALLALKEGLGPDAR